MNAKQIIKNTIQAPIQSGLSGKTTAKKALGNRDLKRSLWQRDHQDGMELTRHIKP